jgi:hypothetical protein
MNRRSLFQVFSAVASGLLLPPVRSARAFSRRIVARAARWRHHPAPAWLDAYGGHHVATVSRPSQATRVNVADEGVFRATLADTEAESDPYHPESSGRWPRPSDRIRVLTEQGEIQMYHPGHPNMAADRARFELRALGRNGRPVKHDKA